MKMMTPDVERVSPLGNGLRPLPSAIGPLALICMAACIIRACGIWFAFWHWDEHQVILAPVSIYGPIPHLLSVPPLLLVRAVSSVIGTLDDRGAGPAWLTQLIGCRVWISVLPSFLTVPLLYTIAHRVCERDRVTAGLCSSLFLCFAFTHVEQAHFAVPDSLNTLLITGALALSTGPLTPTQTWLAGLVCALAVGCKINSFFVILARLCPYASGRSVPAKPLRG